MRPLRSWLAGLARLAGMFGAGRSDIEINQELLTHREMLADHYRRSGMPCDAARRRAAAEFGSIASVSDTYRERRGVPSLESLLRDVRMAARSLARTPVLSASMVLVLGLGIGIATALVAVFHAIVWDTLPVENADRVVQLGQRFEGAVDRRVQGNVSGFSFPEVETYRRMTRRLSTVAASTRTDVAWRHHGTTPRAARHARDRRVLRCVCGSAGGRTDAHAVRCAATYGRHLRRLVEDDVRVET